MGTSELAVGVGDTQLALYQQGLLDPCAEAEVAARLAHSPALRQRLDDLALAPDPLPERAPLGWRVPPPGLGHAMAARRPDLLGDGPVRVGDRFQITLPDTGADTDREVVVLRRVQDDWEVVAPTGPASRAPLTLFPAQDGARVLDLLAVGPPGQQRWAVALPPRDFPVDWDRPLSTRWRGLQKAIASGLVPIGSVSITVTSR